jgi:hypothetical protein
VGLLGMSEHQSPHPIVVLPSQQGWEREANSRWDEETGRKESRKKKCLLGSAPKQPFKTNVCNACHKRNGRASFDPSTSLCLTSRDDSPMRRILSDDRAELLIRELHRHPTPERLPDEGGPLDTERARDRPVLARHLPEGFDQPFRVASCTVSVVASARALRRARVI